ncbi:MAG: GvpL/GvpF family gas vesicle protein [candidate division Zixibacteria bacterium]|nr:GvpL/GvpF family gas vesicle protein [candidate division Zixibacteria bacterium]
MEKEGKYIYCIIESDTPQSFGATGIGGRGDEVHTVCSNGLAAEVSNSPIKKYPVSRENLLCHQRTVEEAMKTHTVLPVKFVTIAKDEQQVKMILEAEHDKFMDLFKKLDGKEELGLKAIFKEDVIYDKILGTYHDIKAAKEGIASLSPEERHHQLIEVGRQVEVALQKEREICAEAISSALVPLSVDMKVNDTYGSMMILNAAFLVEKCREGEFDEKVEELNQRFGDAVSFKYVGPVPACNFVNLVIEMEKYPNGISA